MSSVLVTYVYPSVQCYLPGLIDCINNQTTDKFEIIFFNDGLNSLENYLCDDKIKIPYHTYDLSGTIAEIRFKSFKILSEMKYENIIFQDADDRMTRNRIEEAISYLESFSVVVNDFDLIDVDGDKIKECFWSDRLSHGSIFDSNFLLDKNFVGLGNSSVKRNLLSLPFEESDSVIAVDWFFFYQILSFSNFEGIFINSSRTLYRQHESNTVGITHVNKTRIEQAKKVKKIHYRELNRIGYNFELQLSKLQQTDKINKHRINNKKHHFWWEETEYLQ